jgi:hypothetical protein
VNAEQRGWVRSRACRRLARLRHAPNRVIISLPLPRGFRHPPAPQQRAVPRKQSGIPDRFPALSLASPSLFRKRGGRRCPARGAVAGDLAEVMGRVLTW